MLGIIVELEVTLNIKLFNLFGIVLMTNRCLVISYGTMLKWSGMSFRDLVPNSSSSNTMEPFGTRHWYWNWNHLEPGAQQIPSALKIR